MPLESLVAPVSGVVLILLGLAFLRRHRRLWQARRDDPALDPTERAYYAGQHRRRMLTSGLILLLGVLIPVGDFLLDARPAPPAVPTTLYWIAVLLTWISVLLSVLLVLLLGVADLFATSLHAKDALLRVRAERAALERELDEVRRSLRERQG